MADSSIVFRLRFCRAQACGTLFWICRPCDRGHRYCSERCRQKARRQQRREANRRHQQSPEGQLDHRDRQRAYRRRRRERVTDQGRREDRIFLRMTSRDSFRFSMPSNQGERSEEQDEKPHFEEPHCFRIRCVVCGRSGLWIDPFPERGPP